MVKASIPPISQQIFPSACTANDKFVVPLSESNGTFDPESGPANVEEMARETNGTVGEDENVQFTIRRSGSYR
jgi:hypothetical protein